MERLFGYEPTITRPANGGVQHLFEFPNGWIASVVRGPYTYGGQAGLWELAVLDHERRLRYDTPITNDVLGWLDDASVREALDKVAALASEVTS